MNTLNTRDLQCLVEGIAQGGNRIPSPAWAGKERRMGKAGSEVLGCQRPAVHQSLNQVPAQSEPLWTCRTCYAG
jgi:hypothetical protein